MSAPETGRDAFAAQVAELQQRLATVHERVACPRCGAPVNVGCRNVTRSYRRGQPVKNAHAERLRADGIPLR